MSTHGSYKNPIKPDDYAPSFGEAHGVMYGFLGIRLSKAGIPFRLWRFANGSVSASNRNRNIYKEFRDIREVVRWLDES